MSADPYAHLDAAYVLGGLDRAERAGFEAHLATCPQCQANVAEIVGVPPLLAGLDESAFAEPAGAPVEPVPDILLPGLLRVAGRERTRRRWLTAGLGLVAAASLTAVVVTAVPPNGQATPAPRAMTALVASPVSAAVALRATQWGTEIDLTCWYRPDASVAPGYEYKLVAYDADGDAYDAGSWRLDPGRKVSLTGGTALTPEQISSVNITKPDGTAILTLAV
ncbi:anti-sigma factor family protein [Pseudofrankia asymbiotica]|uniref:Putative zinc-finger domain-containing protein n=1 Tax=Pseudofrankia asymbiotica TaxID=1834516 RepID=A0A1V2IEI6_9ACTN|nr:zf-HC2 domain-containing protein [Pseudofrankia asymbiotica]ONH30851.1 hypothetical protein BL253_12175 [Pseudofrankia asymbiotica]